MAADLQVTDKDRQQQQTQRKIQEAVEAGNVDEALRLTEAAAPGLLNAEPSPHIVFQLKVLKFIELVGPLPLPLTEWHLACEWLMHRKMNFTCQSSRCQEKKKPAAYLSQTRGRNLNAHGSAATRAEPLAGLSCNQFKRRPSCQNHGCPAGAFHARRTLPQGKSRAQGLVYLHSVIFHEA